MSTQNLVLIAALFIIAKHWKQPKCPATETWINKMWYMYMIEYYWDIKKMKYWYMLWVLIHMNYTSIMFLLTKQNKTKTMNWSAPNSINGDYHQYESKTWARPMGKNAELNQEVREVDAMKSESWKRTAKEVRKGHEGETFEWESIPSEEGDLSPLFSEQLEEAWHVHLQLEQIFFWSDEHTLHILCPASVSVRLPSREDVFQRLVTYLSMKQAQNLREIMLSVNPVAVVIFLGYVQE